MTKIVSYLYALALVICVGTTAMLAASNHNVKSNPSLETGLASDGGIPRRPLPGQTRSGKRPGAAPGHRQMVR